MKKIRITRWCFVTEETNILVIDSTGCKMNAGLKWLAEESREHCLTCFSIEEYTKNNSYSDLMRYDYIFVLADNTIRNSKGLFEWSRFVRKCVESDNDDEAELIVKYMRSMSGKECIYFKKKDDRFVWKKDVLK